VLDTEAASYETAIARLQKAVQRDPGDGVAWYFLGVNYLRTRNPTEAFRCARERKVEAGSEEVEWRPTPDPVHEISDVPGATPPTPAYRLPQGMSAIRRH
jgi:hypothetical protein